MPEAKKHLDKYQHNKTLLNTELFSNTIEYNDWSIIISFYAVLHVIEKSFAELNMHFPGHTSRNKFLFSTKKYENIAPKYHTLYNQSIKARYKCIKITNSDVQTVKKLVEEIESELLA